MKIAALRFAAFTLSVAVAVLGVPEPATASTCTALRQSIVDMDSKAVKPPGYAAFRTTLLANAARCSDVPPPVPVDVSHCANSGNESICTLMTEASASCRRPRTESKRVCEMLFGPGYASESNGRRMQDWDLPPTPISLDGSTYQLDANCTEGLFGLWGADEGGPNTLKTRATERDRYLTRMKDSCPDFLAALEQRTGRNASTDMANFWPALGELVMSNFAPRGAPPVTARSFQNDAGFQQRCAEARANQDICLQRQGNMGPVGQESRGKAGQAGAFGECAALYGAFARMCGATEQAAVRQTPQAQPQKPPPAANNAPSARQPASLTGLSPACRSQLNQALEAADRGDSARATAVYETMRSSGCDSALRGLSTEVEMGLPERKPLTLANRYFKQECVKGDCGATAPSTPEQSARAAQNAFYPDEVMEFLFGLGGLAVTAAGYYTPAAGGMMVNSNRFSTVNQRARSTYGYGGPVYSTPRQGPSGLTGVPNNNQQRR